MDITRLLLCLCCKASWGRGYVGVSFTKSRALVEWSGSRVKAFFPHSRSISDLSQGKEDEHHLFPVVQESCCEDIATATTHAHTELPAQRASLSIHALLSTPTYQNEPRDPSLSPFPHVRCSTARPLPILLSNPIETPARKRDLRTG